MVVGGNLIANNVWGVGVVGVLVGMLGVILVVSNLSSVIGAIAN